jgi:hypothetical protein
LKLDGVCRADVWYCQVVENLILLSTSDGGVGAGCGVGGLCCIRTTVSMDHAVTMRPRTSSTQFKNFTAVSRNLIHADGGCSKNQPLAPLILLPACITAEQGSDTEENLLGKSPRMTGRAER